MSLGKSGQKELAVVFDGFEEVSFALQGKSLLHLTGAAGVVLRTQSQVLTWTVKPDQREKERLGLMTHTFRNLKLDYFGLNVTQCSWFCF